MGVLSDMAARIVSSGALPPGRSPIVLSDPPPAGYGPDWKKVAETAEAVRAAGIPDELNRWLTMTPAQLAAADAAVRRQVEDFRNRSTTMKAPAPGSKGAQLRAFREAAAAAAPKPQPPRKAVASTTTSGNTPTPIAPPAQPAQPGETTMSKKPKGAKAPKAKKTKTAKKAKPAAAGERARYDWAGAAEKAKAGTVPASPDFSAPTHDRFRPLIDAVVAAAKAGDAAALKAIKITPTSSTPKALDRYRGLCVEALKAK